MCTGSAAKKMGKVMLDYDATQADELSIKADDVVEVISDEEPGWYMCCFVCLCVCMKVCVCLCVCLWVYICVCLFVSLILCTYVSVCICLCLCLCVYICVSMSVCKYCMYLPAHACTHLHVFECMCLHVFSLYMPVSAHVFTCRVHACECNKTFVL